MLENIFQSKIIAWFENSRFQNRLEILLENDLPFNAKNFSLTRTGTREIKTNGSTFHVTYYGFLVDYYLDTNSGSPHYPSSDFVLNDIANENIKDVWINNVRWGIDQNILDIILEETQDKKFTDEEVCPVCGRSMEYEEVIRHKVCSRCLPYFDSQEYWKETIYFNNHQKIYISENAHYTLDGHKLQTDSHVVIRDSYGRKKKREVLRGHIRKGEQLVEVKPS